MVERSLRQRGFRTRLIGEQGDFDKLTDRTGRWPRPWARLSSCRCITTRCSHGTSKQGRIDGRELKYADRFSGFSLFVSRGNPAPEKSLACARAIGRKLREAGYTPSLHHAEPIRGENRPLADAANGIYYFDDLVVLKTATVPAVLVEAGIILNRSDELLLRQPSTRQRLGAAIAEALRDCLGLSSTPGANVRQP